MPRDLARVRRARGVQSVLSAVAFSVLIAWTIGGAIMNCGRGCEPRSAHAEAPPVVGALAEPGSVGGRASSPPAAHTPGAGGEPSHVLGYQPPATEAERAIIDRALYDCNKASARHLDVWLALRLLRVEETAGLPRDLRGLLLSVGCGEVAYQTGPDVRGDGGKAVGWAQIHEGGALHAWCGAVELEDVEANVRCWLGRVDAVARGKALRRCGPAKAWQAAEAWVSMGGHSGYACDAKSGHWRRLEEWAR